MPQAIGNRQAFLNHIAEQVAVKEHRPFVVALDGRSGAGKTSLAADLCEELQQRGYPAIVFHLEDTYQGWRGLAQAVEAWKIASAELAAGKQLTYTGWDWETSRSTGPHTRAVLPGTVLIVEGVGAAQGTADLSCWITAPTSTRKERALTRDGETYRPWWDIWAQQESQLIKSTGIDRLTDIVFDNGD